MPDTEGSWNLSARFDGDNDHDIANSNPVTLTIQPQLFFETPVRILLVIVIILAVVVFVKYVRR
jgi:hypothetical protein